MLIEWILRTFGIIPEEYKSRNSTTHSICEFVTLFFVLFCVCNSSYFTSTELSSFQSHSSSEPQVYIIQVDTRPRKSSEEYWTITSIVNKYYAEIHGYHYIYLRSSNSCTKPGDEGKHDVCEGPNGLEVHSPWMKAKGTLSILKETMKMGDILLFMDSDAMIAVKWERGFGTGPDAIHMSIQDAFPAIWDSFMNGTKSAAFIRSINSYWVGVSETWNYSIAINTGVFIIKKNDFSLRFIERWWNSFDEETPGDRVYREKGWEMATHWPWEQERLSWLASTHEEDQLAYFDPKLGWSTSAMPLVLHYCARDKLRSKTNCLNDGTIFLQSHFQCKLAGLEPSFCPFAHVNALVSDFLSPQDVVIL